MRSIRVLSFTLLLAAATISARAEAQAPATSIDAASARADELAHQGNDLALKHSWAEAEALFRQAWTLKQSYDIGGNLGIAELNLEKYCDAAEHLSFALKRFPANGKPDHRELLHDKLEKAKAHVGALAITVSAPGAEVLIDGKRLGVTPLADLVFVEPGTRKVEARLQGSETAMQTVEVTKGGSTDLTLTLKTAEGPHVLPPGSHGPRMGVVVAGAVVTGVALAAGIGFLAAAGGKGSSGLELHNTIAQANHNCIVGDGNYDTRCVDLGSISSTGDTFHSVGVGLLAGAGAAAVGTAVYYFWPRSSADRPAPSGFRFTPAVSATNAGLLVSGSF
jgi:hypothetical protein